MNHNTARCSSCNTICVLPHLRARASAAKCEACARREAERVRDAAPRWQHPYKVGDVVDYDLHINGKVQQFEIQRIHDNGIVAATLGTITWLLRVERIIGLHQPDKWEQRARELPVT